MTTVETIEFAERLLVCKDKYEVAMLLINHDHQIETEAIKQFSNRLQKGLKVKT